MPRTPFVAIVLTSAIASARAVVAAEPCVTLEDKAVAALFDEWNFALSSLDANQVAQRYWPNAVLLPTASNTPGTSPAMIGDYFKQFLVKRPRGHIDTRTIQSGCNLAVDMGTYTFSLMDDKGMTSTEAARYTFVYQYRDGAWKILHQHSSAMPVVVSNADANAAGGDVAEGSGPAKLAKTESAQMSSRKQRRPWRKDYLEPEVVKPAKAATPSSMANAQAAPKPTVDAAAAAEAKPIGDTKLPPEVRTAMFANLTTSPSPAKFYPPEAARRKERGSVNLKVCADGQGALVDSMEVVRSSGSELLDEAAMTWAREVTWVPATFNNRRVEGCAKVDVSFEPPPDLAHART